MTWAWEHAAKRRPRRRRPEEAADRQRVAQRGDDLDRDERREPPADRAELAGQGRRADLVDREGQERDRQRTGEEREASGPARRWARRRSLVGDHLR
jgi:hypothetical protein